MSSDQLAATPAKSRGSGPGRTSTSCSECQRRKQKCDKQWPCRHCQDRRVPHLCQFKKKCNDDCSQEVVPKRQLPRASSPPKRKFEDLAPGDGGAEYAKRVLHINDEQLAVGFADPPRSAWYQQYLDQPDERFTTKALTGADERIQRYDGDKFPARPYADVLVHNFFDNINFVYCIIHPESFFEEYTKWWQTRRTTPDIELESLLLRICAISSQFLPESVCERLESELYEDIQDLKQGWHEAADRLCGQLRPGKGGTKHVQQLYLKATYFKTEAMFVESWHALSEAIRIAQEIDMHKDSPDPKITDFEREVRRAVWISLYTWDRLMAYIFDRPVMIHRAHCKLVEPKLAVWVDPIHPDLPSPLLGRLCEFRMSKILDKYLDEDLSQADIRTIIKPLKDVKAWLDDLPPVFRVRNPDTTHDGKHKRIKHYRLALQTNSYIVLFHLLQPCLIDDSFPKDATEVDKEKLRSACMDYCLKMTDLVDRLTATASHSRYHMSFCLFETSITACAAMVKDTGKKLPKREEVSRAMGRAQDILERLGSTTAVARSSAPVLTNLMEKLKLDQPDTVQYIEEGRVNPLFPAPSEAASTPGGKDSAIGSSVGSPSTSEAASHSTGLSSNTSPMASLDEYAEKDAAEAGTSTYADTDAGAGSVTYADAVAEVDTTVSAPFKDPAELFGQMDFGMLDDIWDWDNLHFQVDMNAADMALQQLPEVH